MQTRLLVVMGLLALVFGVPALQAADITPLVISTNPFGFSIHWVWDETDTAPNFLDWADLPNVNWYGTLTIDDPVADVVTFSATGQHLVLAGSPPDVGPEVPLFLTFSRSGLGIGDFVQTHAGAVHNGDHTDNYWLTVTRLDGTTLDIELTAPEPGSFALFGLGGAGLVWLARRRRKQA